MHVDNEIETSAVVVPFQYTVSAGMNWVGNGRCGRIVFENNVQPKFGREGSARVAPNLLNGGNCNSIHVSIFDTRCNNPNLKNIDFFGRATNCFLELQKNVIEILHLQLLYMLLDISDSVSTRYDMYGNKSLNSFFCKKVVTQPKAFF